MVDNSKDDYRVETDVYRVADRYRYATDESWYEYRVKLYLNDELIDEWDSIIETYNGVKAQRLTQKSAKRSAQQVVSAVEDGGEVEEYFTI